MDDKEQIDSIVVGIIVPRTLEGWNAWNKMTQEEKNRFFIEIQKPRNPGSTILLPALPGDYDTISQLPETSCATPMPEAGPPRDSEAEWRPSIGRSHMFSCPECGKVVDNFDMFNFCKALTGNDEIGIYIDFGGDTGKKYLHYFDES